ncbi:Rhombotin-2,LIM domain transcription factor LMO4.2,LIM domain transcription factor LMO4-A,LIM domain transcription factor LMO4.1,LIM domain only protein 3,Rhombotin-1,LIM domain transcription factor LMO4,LIM domain transcription factor LMO4-B [Mytilus edulis]|uniref:LIM zinc-binding domain-containing protein n=1 Tax=Mytilus edulis TaxID=6550 RepID=A0A8S3RJT9_MYTED|nr:Rhombotin-2,LIM domain transcription factor LMO4.2,LIM domain transcription factor LMO4-A,LIM domain transcription factor LMO4.1,LIM domain only protein 3,Rhombotin-1,LIM domain transcription factor LMO4,LIM domain transcription factor LMO4-B [Mytilus edulis]
MVGCALHHGQTMVGCALHHGQTIIGCAVHHSETMVGCFSYHGLTMVGCVLHHGQLCCELLLDVITPWSKHGWMCFTPWSNIGWMFFTPWSAMAGCSLHHADEKLTEEGLSPLILDQDVLPITGEMTETELQVDNSGQMQISQESASSLGVKQECTGCKKEISERYMLKAMDQYWHEDCLKCSCCDCRLGEVGSTLFAKANLLLCRRDYLRLFGTTGYCAACSKMIPAFEMVMRAKSNVYHLECFACQQCNHRFCVGDKFYLCDNKILCEYDYEERMVFANMPFNYNALTQIKRQTQSLSDDLSSGYGSPSPGSL